MFYDRFYELCQRKGVTPTKVARDLGLRQSTVSMWKKQGTTPKYDTLQKLSDYFGVSVDYLLGKAYTQDGVSFSDGTGFGGGSGSGVGFGNGCGYGGPIPMLPDEAEADDFEENLEKLSGAARSALELPKITEAKERLSHILDELSYEDLETLVKFAQFTKYQREEAQEPAQPPAEATPESTPCPQVGTDTTPPEKPAEGPPEGE